tara:strand:+ start:366 stop:557 length:192 start_codon:yes stop_codon:yes gene_type:complete
MKKNEDFFLKVTTPIFKVWTIYALYISFTSVILIPLLVVGAVVTQVVSPVTTAQQVHSSSIED